ncbi:MAG: DNA-3-methyladenine glycosylase family protein [Candidatus Rokuibacteriota bacterium]
MEASFVVPGPLDVAGTLSRFHLWGEDPANRLSDGVFRRAVKWDGRWCGYELRWSGGPDFPRLRVSVPGVRRTAAVDAAVAEVQRICGLDVDLPSFYGAAAEDPVLGGLAPLLYGLRPTLSPGPFEMLVGSVCAQQVNLTFAFAVRARLVRRYGEPIVVGGQALHAFPEPSVLARARVADLRRMQFTTRKAEYVVGLAQKVATGALDLDGLASLSNDEVIERLTAVRGFGRWSAEWFLARCLGRGDVCPAGDLAVRRAFEHFYGRGRVIGEPAIRRRAAAWCAHQNVAVHYLLAGRRLAARATAGGGA